MGEESEGRGCEKEVKGVREGEGVTKEEGRMGGRKEGKE